MNKKSILLMPLAAFLASCTLNPDYQRPVLPAASAWESVPGYERPEGEMLATQMDWKQFFDSQALWRVVGIALQNNKDLKQAALRIEEARARYRIERADLMPAIGAQAQAALEESTDESSATGRGAERELYDANIGLSRYEIDLFGKLRSQNEAALNEYLATTQAQAAVRNALIAETANAYLQLLADQKLLSLTEKTLAAQKHTYDILSESLEKGLGTGQDVARAQTAVETAQVNLHQYRRAVAQDKNALYVLMGVRSDEADLPHTTLDNLSIAENISPGLPAEILLMRPDVRQAEYELRARNADIGAARAAFFPSITLIGTYGFASTALSNLFSSAAAGAWSFVPQITLPIFQGGRNQANLDLSEIRKQQAIVQYEQVIQDAFREVSDELAARATLDEQLKAQRRLVGAAQKVYDVSEARYKAGVDSFLSVLDAQRELYVFQQNEIQIERQRLSNLVNLYKVLGGGAYQ